MTGSLRSFHSSSASPDKKETDKKLLEHHLSEAKQTNPFVK